MVSESRTSGSSKGMPGGGERPGAGGDQDDTSVQSSCAAVARVHKNRATGPQSAAAADQLNAVARDVVGRGRGHRLDDVRRPGSEMRDCGARVELKADAVDVSLLEAGHIEGCLTERLGGDTGVAYCRAAGCWLALHDGDAPPEVSGLRRRLFAGRPGANHDQIELLAHDDLFVAGVLRHP